MGMHPAFADWYRTAAVTVPEGQLQKRWAGVESLVEKADASMVIAMTKLFVLPSKELLVPEGMREAFREQDESFPSRENLHELRVLAGAVIRQII